MVGHAFSRLSQQVHAQNDFCNTTRCSGLTPGYWVNWANHYTSSEFLGSLVGMIGAGNVNTATSILTSTGCDDGDALNCMRRFLLADQLTINLTKALAGGSTLFNGSGGDLTGICRLPGIPYDLTYWIDRGLAISANPGGYTRDQILEVKTALAAFSQHATCDAG